MIALIITVFLKITFFSLDVRGVVATTNSSEPRVVVAHDNMVY